MTHDVPEDSKVTEGLSLMSVITPTYSGEKLIREAVKSLLAQDSPALEIIVADCYACAAHTNQPKLDSGKSPCMSLNLDSGKSPCMYGATVRA